MEYLETKAAEQDDDDDFDDDDDNWSLDLMMQEDIYFKTVLDSIDAYNRFEEFMTLLPNSQPQVYAHLSQTLTAEKKTAIEALIMKSQSIRLAAAQKEQQPPK